MQFAGTINNIGIDYITQKTRVELLLNCDELSVFDKLLKEEKIGVELKKFSPKRSLDANAYCWVLCDMIAKEISKDGVIVKKEKVYQDAILGIGTFEPFIVQEKGFEKFKRIWERQGLGFLVQKVSEKDKCIRVNCYYGSSTYDSKEMSLLINLLVEEAKEYNLETKPKEELESLLNSWGGNK